MGKESATARILSGKIALLVLFLSFLGGAMIVPVEKSYAAGCCSCEDTADAKSETEWEDETEGTIKVITRRIESEFTAQRIWIVQLFWEDNLLPAMMLMAEQLTSAGTQQVQMISAFLDAKQQKETERTLQAMTAQTHKEYHPSVGMCEFGTSVRSLAASERKGELNAFVMSQRMQDRAIGHRNTAAQEGNSSDEISRLTQFRNTFCDMKGNNNGLSYICARSGLDLERLDKDIDYARTVDWPWTMNVDFSDTTLTDHEEELLALGSNLFGDKLFTRPPSITLDADSNTQNINYMQSLYQDIRAILAKRSVAENSFNAITAMKTVGTPGSREYLITVLKELGIPQDEAEELMGSTGNNKLAPSYYAQMEILTKKAFENPDFYTNLYDKPANVDRKNVALQAIGLMQKFDLYKSYLRREASASVLLELAVMDEQEDIENKIRQQKEGGTGAKN